MSIDSYFTLSFNVDPMEYYHPIKGKITATKIGAVVKQDNVGYILDPMPSNMKCGWGNTIADAIDHFKVRNLNVKNIIMEEIVD